MPTIRRNHGIAIRVRRETNLGFGMSGVASHTSRKSRKILTYTNFR